MKRESESDIERRKERKESQVLDPKLSELSMSKVKCS